MTSPPSDIFSEVHLPPPTSTQSFLSSPLSPLSWQDDIMMLFDNNEPLPHLSPLISEDGQSLRSSRSHSVERPKRQEPTEEDIRTRFALIRRCTELGHPKAGMEIFLNLCKEIEAPSRSEWRPISREVKRKYRGLSEEVILAHAQQVISELEAEHSSSDEVLLDLCNIVAVLYFVPELLVPEIDRKELSPTDFISRLDEGRKLLERVLKRGLDNETVKKLLDATSFDESLPSEQDPVDGVLETLILQGAKQPFLAYACGALSQYYNLRSRYSFSIALLQMIDDCIARRRIFELSKNVEALIQMGWVTTYEVRYRITLTINLY
jgi:hypothetical protein